MNAKISATVAQMPETIAQLRRQFDNGRTRSLGWRVRQLEGIVRMIEERQPEIEAALKSDLGKPAFEAFTTEIQFIKVEAESARKRVRSWMKPTRVRAGLPTQPATARIHKDPLGVVLVIAPWNYPFQLSMGPVLGAVAAGNAVVLKPSEVAPATSALLARLVPEYLDPEAVIVVEGGIPETTALLQERFDHILYTGNGTVGRIVMTAAAKHLTPVTLELGGKSPAIVLADAQLEVTARRLMWGKFTNAGQTCIAPDYILVEDSVHDALVAELKKTIEAFYGSDPQQSPDFARIINTRHHQRLMKLLDGVTVAHGGQADEESCYIAPTLLTDVTPDAAVMQDEIFGPILPILRIGDVNEAISLINARPKPLALYLFTKDKAAQSRVLNHTSSGGACINHCVMHVVPPELPFGGVGESGMGAYHGKASFDTFTHHKSVLSKPFAIDPPLVYPPYTESKAKWVKRLM